MTHIAKHLKRTVPRKALVTKKQELCALSFAQGYGEIYGYWSSGIGVALFYTDGGYRVMGGNPKISEKFSNLLEARRYARGFGKLQDI